MIFTSPNLSRISSNLSFFTHLGCTRRRWSSGRSGRPTSSRRRRWSSASARRATRGSRARPAATDTRGMRLIFDHTSNNTNMHFLTLRVRNVLFGGECRKCDCNGHSATCDPFTFECGVSRAIHYLLDFAPHLTKKHYIISKDSNH